MKPSATTRLAQNRVKLIRERLSPCLGRPLVIESQSSGAGTSSVLSESLPPRVRNSMGGSQNVLAVFYDEDFARFFTEAVLDMSYLLERLRVHSWRNVQTDPPPTHKLLLVRLELWDQSLEARQAGAPSSCKARAALGTFLGDRWHGISDWDKRESLPTHWCYLPHPTDLP